MKTTENVTIYQCDHCSKKMVRRKAMIKHETLCYCNPNNQRACSGCSFLDQIEVEYAVSNIGTEYEKSRTAKSYECSKLNQIMYPFMAEKRGLPTKYPETFEGQIPMPKSCDLFDCSVDDCLPW